MQRNLQSGVSQVLTCEVSPANNVLPITGELPVIVGAGGHACLELPMQDCWREQPGQNAKDGDHHHQLDQGESCFDTPISCHSHFDSERKIGSRYTERTGLQRPGPARPVLPFGFAVRFPSAR
jgi:hypothetical protein